MGSLLLLDTSALLTLRDDEPGAARVEEVGFPPPDPRRSARRSPWDQSKDRQLGSLRCTSESLSIPPWFRGLFQRCGPRWIPSEWMLKPNSLRSVSNSAGTP